MFYLLKSSFFYLLIFLILGGLTTHAQKVLTLPEAIATGLENNYGIRLAKKDLQIADNNYSLGNAGFLPTIDASASQNYTIENTQQEFIENRTQEREGARSQRFNAEAVLQWTIFDGLGMFIRYDQLEALRKAENFSLESTIENQVANVIKGYYTVVLEKERMEVFKSNLSFSRQIRDIAQSKYEIGKFSKLDYLTAQVDYNTDSSNYLAQAEALHNMKVELNQLMGRSPSEDFTIVDDITITNTLEQDTLQQMLLNQNPILREMETGKSISQLQLQQLKAQRYPVINLNAGYLYGSSSAEAGFLISRRAYGPTFGASARMNIFNGNNLNRQQENAQIDIEKSEISYEQVKTDLLGELDKTFFQYTNNLALINLEESNLKVAEERKEIALDRYEIGNSSALEVREAQLNRLNAEMRYILVLYNAKISETELLRLSSIILNQ